MRISASPDYKKVRYVIRVLGIEECLLCVLDNLPNKLLLCLLESLACETLISVLFRGL